MTHVLNTAAIINNVKCLLCVQCVPRLKVFSCRELKAKSNNCLSTTILRKRVAPKILSSMVRAHQALDKRSKYSLEYIEGRLT